MITDAPAEQAAYDVAIIGGALSGAATAMVLLQQKPGLKVLIIEKSTAFGRKVGEATVELSGYFLSHVLGLTQYLNEHHLVKQGMRFWFQNGHTTCLADSSEIGGKYMARVPAYQVDRSALDEEVLRRAVALGAELWRPVSVSRVELKPGGMQELQVRQGSESRSVRARWVIDASGIAAVLARQNEWIQPNLEHPTTAVWARWKGVVDWDGLDLARKYPRWAAACCGVRSTATNHIVGRGWWAWCIPLKGGDTSIGVVMDQRLATLPEGDSVGQRLKSFLSEHPVGREVLAQAQWNEGDVHFRKNLAYVSKVFAGDGFALVGDAAAFMDPFYSPGLDWASFTACSAAQLVLAERNGQPVESEVAEFNRKFARAYQHWFEAVYKDKYEYMGDYELMRLAFMLDLGLYYLGVASQPFKYGPEALCHPVFTTPASVPFYRLMRLYNRRLAAMGRSRFERGTWGRQNHSRRFMFPGYTFEQSSSTPILKALLGWAMLELKEGWRTWLPMKGRAGQSKPSALGSRAATLGTASP